MNDINKKLGLFEDFVGQDRLQKQLRFYLDSYHSTHYFPSCVFAAPKGNGKTTLAKELAKGLVLFDDKGHMVIDPDSKKPKRKKFVVINCSTLKSVKAFINGVVLTYIQDKDVTILFDEASELPRPITMALLNILDPSQTKTTFSHEDYTCEFDFMRQTFLFATSEIQKVFHALLDRLTRFDLEDYSLSEMEKILMKSAKGVNFEPAVLPEIASVLRGNARAAAKMASDVRTYLKGKTEFVTKDWNKLKDILGIIPLGLSPTELAILRILAGNNEGTPLTSLAAQTGLTRDAIQKDYEMYLQKHGLMEISTTGRMITAKGLDYLRSMTTGTNPHFRSKLVVQ